MSPVRVVETVSLERDIQSVLINNELYLFPSIFNKRMGITKIGNEASAKCVQCGEDYSGDNFGNVIFDDYRGNQVALKDAKMLLIMLQGKHVYSCIVNKANVEYIMGKYEEKDFMYEFQFSFNNAYVDDYVFQIVDLIIHKEKL